MATAEGVFPKVGNDPAYASEVNKYISEEFKQRVKDVYYFPTVVSQVDYNENSCINYGAVFGSGLSTNDVLFDKDKISSNVYEINKFKELPFVSGTTGSVFESSNIYVNGSKNIIFPYVNFEVLTSYDECAGSVNTSLWSSGGTILSNNDYYSFSGVSHLQTAEVLPKSVSKIQINHYLGVTNQAGNISSDVQIVGSNIGSVNLIHVYEPAGFVRAGNMKGTAQIYTDLTNNSNNFDVSYEKYVSFAEEVHYITETIHCSENYSGNVYLKFITTANEAQIKLKNVRWFDRNTNYASTGSVYVSNDGGTSWESATNGYPHSFSSPGSVFKLKAIYSVTGSEVIQQNSWGMKVY